MGWTLNYEMYFYLLFAIALKVSHALRGVLVSLALLAVFILCQFLHSFPAGVYGNLIVFEFVLGIMLYLFMRQGVSRQVVFLLGVIGVALLFYSGGLHHRFFVYGLPALVVIYGLLRVFSGVSMPRIFVTLGGASYALYLTHPYVIQVFDKVTAWFGGTTTEKTVAVVLSLLLTNILAVLVYRYLEVPMRTALRRIFLKP